MIGEQYASLYPKVKAWKQGLLNKQDLDSLYRMNLSELIGYIKSRTKKVSIETENIVDVEGLIKQEGFYFIQSAVRFLSGSSRDFLKSWSKIYEIENLKILTRAVLSGKPLDFFYELGSSSRIQLDLVKEIKSLEEVQQFLSGTEYYRLAQDSFARIKEDKNPFYFEINLDNYYALTIKRKMSSLAIEDRKEVRAIFSYYLEVNRILWIYRAKFNYGMSNEDVISIIPNVLNVLPHSHYTRLIEADNQENFIAALKGFGLIDKEAEINENFSLEKEVNLALLKRAGKHVSGNPFSLGVFLGFIIMHQVNVRNLVVLLESKKVQLESEKTAKLMVIR